MGAGGRQNYAQAAMQTLFGEQLRQLQNQAAQPAEVNQELVKQYTPERTSTKDTVQDVLKRYTEGTGAVPTSQSAGLQGILDKIAAEKEALKDLTVTETSTRMVPQYEMTTVSPSAGLPGAPPPTYKMVTELPKGATLRESQYGGKYYQVPMQNQSATTFAARNPNPTYRQVGTKKITEKFTRQAKAGDPEYDKAFGELGRLQTRHKYRNLYANQPARSTGTSIYSRLGMNQNSPQAASPVTSFTNPYASLAGSPMQVKEGGEIKGKGKAVRGFKFGGVK